MKDLNDIIFENQEPYKSIHDFINANIIPKYPCLTYCHQSNFDEEGTPKIQYWIRYAADLSLKEEDELFLKIFREINEFCFSRGLEDIQELDIDLILTVDGDHYYERIRK